MDGLEKGREVNLLILATSRNKLFYGKKDNCREILKNEKPSYKTKLFTLLNV